MTFALAAYCPWTSDGSGRANGLVMITDCQLTADLRDGRKVVVNNRTRKVFSLGRFAIGAYCGSRWSAMHALGRIGYYVFSQKARVTMDYRLTGRIIKEAYKGAKAAERLVRPEKGQIPGPFRLLVGFVDEIGGVGLAHFSYNLRAGAKEIGATTGTPRIVVIGSGVVVAQEVYDEAMEWIRASGMDVGELEQQHPGVQGTYLASTLDRLLSEKAVPYSGGGVQMISLDREHGHVSWNLYVTSPEVAKQYGLPTDARASSRRVRAERQAGHHLAAAKEAGALARGACRARAPGAPARWL